MLRVADQRARKISKDILEFGQAQHPWVGLGVSERPPAVDPIESSLRQVFVQQVYSNTPAADAGSATVIFWCASRVMKSGRSADVLNAMFYHRIGDQVEFTVLRHGLEQRIVLVVAAVPRKKLRLRVDSTTCSPGPSAPWPVAVPASQER